MTLEEAERWLSPNLAYSPEEPDRTGPVEVPQAASKSAGESPQASRHDVNPE